MLERFVAEMKLTELRRQREHLLSTYDTLTGAVLDTDEARLRHLVDGLSNLRFANRRLHPELANLSILSYQIGSNGSIVRYWLDQTEQAIAQGRNSAEAVYVFGDLLEEWAQAPTKTAAADAPTLAEVLAPLSETPTVGDYASILDPFLAVLKYDTRANNTEWHEHRPIDESELYAALYNMQFDAQRQPEIRSQAQQLLANDQWRREFADALTIMLDKLPTWHYPAEGVPVHVGWAQSKWRVFMDEDMPTACLLEILGFRWRDTINRIIFDYRRHQPLPIPRQTFLRDLNAPDPLVAAATDNSPILRMIDPLAPLMGHPQTADLHLNQSNYYTVGYNRSRRQSTLRNETLGGAYGHGGSSALQEAISFIHAEIQLAKNAFPDAAFHVIKIDLKDLAQRVPHQVLAHMLDQFQLPAVDRQFFNAFMHMRLRVDDQVVQAVHQGIPNARQLSLLLVDTLLRVMDMYVQSVTQVMVVRVMDDICLLTTDADHAVLAWQAVQHFCAACGLSINHDKCGAVTINGTTPAQLPQARPTWQFLQLDEQGDWLLAEAAFDTFLAETHRTMNAATSILSRITSYNAALQYAINGLALQFELGQRHRATIATALSRLHQLADTIVAATSTRHPHVALPDAWYYFPVTAGGLGLQNALLYESVYAAAYDQVQRNPPPPRPTDADWADENTAWGDFYDSVAHVTMPYPNKTATHEAMVDTFIERGKKITGGNQSWLSYYWQWVLYVYGRQILDSFGTFGFLIEELVPMQLIAQLRVSDGSDG